MNWMNQSSLVLKWNPLAIDRNTNNMIVSVNANSPIAGDNGKHPGEDYIYRFSSIEFK